MSERLLTITDGALDKVRGFRAQVEEPERQAMWVEVTGVHRGEFTYNLALKPRDSAVASDAVEDHGDLSVVVPATLARGSESAILQAVPEIRQVVDVTDHGAGANPYYAPAPSA